MPLKLDVGGTYKAPVAFHGVSKKGNIYSRVDMWEESKASDRMKVELWLEGAPEISQGDEFTIKEIKAFRIFRQRDLDGNWKLHETMTIVADVNHSPEHIYVDEVGGENPFEDEGIEYGAIF